ncbi:MATE family efflux transporter [Roseobacter sp. CCS2]|uniref:MATE family efflux transporter n=1 Tax=Roseobacter sp. CCS2 TaxID=391593 RepID=UPI0000F4047F|nr:MATE family efflux transporter [Roseobacter sp. CCS2]EBA14062.1 MATE efflux family protein [Roseobacter sp. CCS2]
MSTTWAIGLFAIFIVDLVDVFFIALLGQPALAAAVGFAGVGIFFGSAICIGIAISIGTLVAQLLGEGDEAAARRLATHGMLYMLVWSVPITILTVVFAEGIMQFLGARGETLAFAVTYFTIVGASLPLLGIAMAGTAILRSAGDAKLAMWSTISGGVVNAVLDPILIFGVGMGLSGAAIASVISRIVVVAVAIFGLIRKHDLLGRIDTSQIWSDFKQLNKIAVPSVITNLSGPIGASYATMQMAKFGTDAVAAASVIGRISPVAFAGLYGLSGAIGPVASQNVGAGQFDRVRETLTAGAKFSVIYMVPVAIVIFALQGSLISLFQLEGDAADLLRFYATFIVITNILFALQLCANPILTALHHPGLGTISNFARDLGLAIPLMTLCAAYFGAPGVLAGQAIANAIAGVATFLVALWLSHKIENGWGLDWPLLSTNCHPERAIPSGVQHRGL